MIHYVYEVKNIIDDKIYVGKHSTENIDDGYMGSGKLLNCAIRKYGIENFRKTIIKQFETAEEAFEFEKQLVNEEFVKDARTYNLAMGGYGGWDKIGIEGSRLGGSISLKKRWANPAWRIRITKETGIRIKKLHSEGHFSYTHLNWSGRKHNEESKKKIGVANSIHQAGMGNSQFGTIWISHPEEKRTQKIKKDELQIFEALGWIKGRKLPK